MRLTGVRKTGALICQRPIPFGVEKGANHLGFAAQKSSLPYSRQEKVPGGMLRASDSMTCAMIPSTRFGTAIST